MRPSGHIPPSPAALPLPLPLRPAWWRCGGEYPAGGGAPLPALGIWPPTGALPAHARQQRPASHLRADAGGGTEGNGAFVIAVT